MIRARLLGVGAAGAVAWACLAGSSARAEETAGTTMCTLTPLEPPTQTSFPLLYSPRHDELTLEVAYVGSWVPVKSAVASTLMYSFAPDDQQWHIGVRGGVTAGAWGADERGPVGLGLGLRVGRDLGRIMDGVLAPYAFVQADAILFASRGDAELRPEAGVGLRVARMIAMELGFEPLVSLAGRASFNGGFGIGMSFDFCAIGSWCSEATPVQTDQDLTAALYTAAATIATASLKVPGLHAALCAAAEDALDAEKHPPSPSDPADTAAAFLSALVANVTDPALRTELQHLLDDHARYRNELLASRGAARTRAQALPAGQLLHDHCIYSPFPVEIRTQLGCP